MRDEWLPLSRDEVARWTGIATERILALWVVTKTLPFAAGVAFLILWGTVFFGGMWAAGSA